MELEHNLEAIRKQELGVVAISYDSVAALKNFADRQHITYPLLSDAESKIIRAFGILNETVKPGSPVYGIPYPGIYVVDIQGRVLAKYFEEDYNERVSTADILARQFGVRPESVRNTAGTRHLQITTVASNEVARPGLRILLSLEISLKPGMHVYAPGVRGYIPIDWKLDLGASVAKAHAFDYPPSEMMHLKAIDETVPIYRGRIRLQREITFAQDGALKPLVSPTGDLVVKGSLRYQDCDEQTCYLPEDVSLEWRFKYDGLDRQRVPAAMQHSPTNR